jgi:hypothetical protein
MIEAIVASMIFLMVFVISLSTVTGFTLREDEGYVLLEAERQMDACLNRYGDGTWTDGAYTEEFGWGKITVRIATYRDFRNIQAVTLTAQLTGSRKTIELRQLIVIFQAASSKVPVTSLRGVTE